MEKNPDEARPSMFGLLSSFMRPQPPAPRSEPIRAETLAKISDDVYDRGSDRPARIDGLERMSEESLRSKGIDPKALHTPSGMHAELYQDSRDGRTVLAFRGTDNPKVEVVSTPFEGPSGLDPEMDMLAALRGREDALRVTGVAQSGRDWMTNFRQGLGYETQQHNDTVSLAKQCEVAFGEKLVLTGHSKGGGQAELASAVTGRPAITFNPAAVHDDTLTRFGLDPARLREVAPERVTSVITRGEAVDSIQGREILGIKTPVPTGKRVEIEADESLGMVARHTMGKGVIPYLDQLSGRQIEMPRPERSDLPRLTPSVFAHGSGSSHLVDPFRFPLYGGFASSLAMMREPPVVLLSDERHPAHGLYSQILERVRDAPEQDRRDAGIVDVGGAKKLSGALTVAALQADFDSADRVVFGNGGRTAFVVQGDPDLGGRRVDVATDTALQTSFRESSLQASTIIAQRPDPVPEPESPKQERGGCAIM